MREEFRAEKLVESIQAALAAGCDATVIVERTQAFRVKSASIEDGIVTFEVDKKRTMLVAAPALLAVIIDEL